MGRSTPTLIQARMSPSITSNASVSTWKAKFHRKSKSANGLALAVQWGSSSATITTARDNKSNDWTKDTAVQDGGNNQSMQWLYFVNCTKDTSELDITFSSAMTFVSVLGCYEFDCINTGGSPLAGSARRTTSGSSLSSGSFNTTERALVLHAVMLDSWPSQTTRATWTRDKDNGYNFLTADGCTFQAAQYAVKEAGAINPALGLSFSATSAMSSTIAFKIQNDAGTPADRFGVRRMHYQGFPYNIDGVITNSTTWSFQFPAAAGLLEMKLQGKNNNNVVSISDTNGNKWQASGTPSRDPSNNHIVESWYAVNRRADEDLVVTVVWNAATGGTPNSAPTIYFREILGADLVNPIAQVANHNGNSAATNGNITGATLSAPAAGGLITGMGQQDGQTITGVTNANATMSAPDIGAYATDGAEKDGSCLDDYSSDGSSYTATYIFPNPGYEGAVAINDYCDQLVSIRAAPTADPGLKPPLPGVHHPMHEPSGWPNEVKSSKAWW